MPFRSKLIELVEKTRAKGAILVDWEGEDVVHFGEIDTYQLKVIGAYQVIIMNHIRSVKSTENVNFFQISFNNAVAQVMPVNKDYCVILIFDNKETAPKALFHLSNVVEIFAKEIQ